MDIAYLFNQLQGTDFNDEDVINALIDGFPYEIYDHFDQQRQNFTSLLQFEKAVKQYLANRTKRLRRDAKRNRESKQIPNTNSPRNNNSQNNYNNNRPYFSTPSKSNTDQNQQKQQNHENQTNTNQFNQRLNQSTPTRFNNNNNQTPKPNKNYSTPNTPAKSQSPGFSSTNSPYKPPVRNVNTMTDNATSYHDEEEMPVINVSTYLPVTMPVYVNDHKVQGLIDTGASISVLSSSVQLPSIQPHKASFTVRLSNGNQWKVNQAAIVELTIAGLAKVVEIAIIDGFPYQALIGTDLIHAFGLVIDASNQTIKASNLPPEPFSLSMVEQERKIYVRARKEIQIPPNSILPIQVVANIKTDSNKTYLFDTLHPLVNHPDLVAAHTLLKFNNDNVAWLSLTNFNTKRSVHIQKHQILGNIQEVDSPIINLLGNSSNESPDPDLSPLQHINLDHLDIHQRQHITALLTDFAHLFKEPENYDSNIKTEHNIELTGPMPRKSHLRRTSPQDRQIIDTEIDKMLKKNVIEPSSSPYAFPIVLVTKKDGTKRFCIDYRGLNAVTRMNAYPLPRTDDTFDSFHGVVILTGLDMKDAYWHVKIRESDRDLTAFISHRGLFRFINMAFGFSNAPATWQSTMDEMFHDYLWLFVLVYMDDLIIFSKSFEDHIRHLRFVFQRLSDYNVHLNPKKCHFAQEEIEYLGHVISTKGILPHPNKLRAISDMPAPTNLKEVRAFLGLAGYYRRFIKDFASIGEPLYRLTRKNAVFDWTPECQQAFDTFKHLLVNPPILAFPNWDAEFIIHCDASKTGLGAILSQLDEDNERVIAYWSRTLSPAERNYHTTEQECLALIESLKQFDHYIFGRKFTVYTDHSALQWLLTKKELTGKLKRWSLMIQSYIPYMKIFYKPGSTHQNADTLSRLPVINLTRKLPPNADQSLVGLAAEYLKEFQIDFKKFSDLQRLDPDFAFIIDYLEKGILPSEKKLQDVIALQSDQYEVIDGLLYHLWYPGGPRRMQRTKFQLAIPSVLRQPILQALHDRIEGSHFGITRTYEKIRERYFWNTLHRDVKTYVQSCPACQLKKKPRSSPAGFLMSISASAPFEIVGVDIIGPLPITFTRHQYIIVFTDYLTRWVEAFPMKNATAETVAEIYVREIITRHGAPKKILSDRGTQFLSNLALAIFKYLGTKKLSTTPYRPQTDGLTEHFNHTLISALSMYVNDHQRDWDLYIPYVLLAYRTSRHASTALSPFSLLYGRDAYSPIDRVIPTKGEEDSYSPDEWTQELHLRLQEAYNIAESANNLAKEAQQRNYDKHRRNDTFEVNDAVLWFNPRIRPGKVQKLDKPYEGPYKIIEKKNDNLYVIRNPAGAEHVTNVERLKKYNPPQRPTLIWPNIETKEQPEEEDTLEETSQELPEISPINPTQTFKLDQLPPIDEDSIPDKLKPAFNGILLQLQHFESNENYSILKLKKELVNYFTSPIIDSSTLSRSLKSRLSKITTRTDMLDFLNTLVYDFNNQFQLEIQRPKDNKGGM